MEVEVENTELQTRVVFHPFPSRSISFSVSIHDDEEPISNPRALTEKELEEVAVSIIKMIAVGEFSGEKD